MIVDVSFLFTTTATLDNSKNTFFIIIIIIIKIYFTEKLFIFAATSPEMRNNSILFDIQTMAQKERSTTFTAAHLSSVNNVRVWWM